ncbi:MAG: cytochrome c biogenesis protein ResB [Eubacteriales bacterium]|nr:cytochrome c biogenesis protein ResB [Eubacteriales bacterium]
MSILKKIWNVFHSMKCAVILLVILAAACTAGSLIPQGEVAAYYTTVYPKWAGSLILAIDLDHMFTAWWFILMAALLCLNLVLCSILRFPQLRKQYCTYYTPGAARTAGGVTARWLWKPKEEEAKKRVFAGLHFKMVNAPGEDGQPFYYAVRRRVGIWGSWICHLGMIAVIIGFGIGQKYMMDTSVYGVPGQEKQVEGTDITVSIDDFQVLLRDDYTVEQYQAKLTVTDTKTGRSQSGTTQVNSPFHAFGMDFFQNSTGWATTAKAYKGDELLEEKVLCQGEFIGLEEIPLQVQMTAFYPDYYNDGTGPQTLSPVLKNPVVIYTIYYDGNFFSMEAIGTGLPIQIDDYRFVFESPRQYTLIQIVKDPTISYVALGGLLMLIGIFLAFFCRTEELWMYEKDGSMMVCCRSRKGAELFAEKAQEMLEREGKLLLEGDAKEEQDVTDVDKY